MLKRERKRAFNFLVWCKYRLWCKWYSRFLIHSMLFQPFRENKNLCQQINIFFPLRLRLYSGVWVSIAWHSGPREGKCNCCCKATIWVWELNYLKWDWCWFDITVLLNFFRCLANCCFQFSWLVRWCDVASCEPYWIPLHHQVGKNWLI